MLGDLVFMALGDIGDHVCPLAWKRLSSPLSAREYISTVLLEAGAFLGADAAGVALRWIL